MAKKQILTLKRLAEISNGGEKAALELANSILSETPEFTQRPNPLDIHVCEKLSWNYHLKANFDIPKVSDEMLKLMAEDVENDIKALKQKIWDYMKEHPTKDRGVIISPETHDLILEEVGYGDGGNACYMYAKKFYFKIKEEYIYEKKIKKESV